MRIKCIGGWGKKKSMNIILCIVQAKPSQAKPSHILCLQSPICFTTDAYIYRYILKTDKWVMADGWAFYKHSFAGIQIHDSELFQLSFYKYGNYLSGAVNC